MECLIFSVSLLIIWIQGANTVQFASLQHLVENFDLTFHALLNSLLSHQHLFHFIPFFILIPLTYHHILETFYLIDPSLSCGGSTVNPGLPFGLNNWDLSS